MLILGIETATERVSVSIGGHEGVIGLFEVTKGRRHAETLVPAIEFLLRFPAEVLLVLSCVAVETDSVVACLIVKDHGVRAYFLVGQGVAASCC